MFIIWHYLYQNTNFVQPCLFFFLFFSQAITVHSTDICQFKVKTKVKAVCVRAKDAFYDSEWSEWSHVRLVPLSGAALDIHPSVSPLTARHMTLIQPESSHLYRLSARLYEFYKHFCFLYRYAFLCVSLWFFCLFLVSTKLKWVLLRNM